jgi:hypothetical protein
MEAIFDQPAAGDQNMKRLIPFLLALVFVTCTTLPSYSQALTSICTIKERNQGGATVEDCIPVGTQSGQAPLPVDTPNGLVIGADNTPSSQVVSVQSTLITPVVTPALASGLVAKANLGTLYGLEISADATLSGADWYVMVHNSTTVPADGAVTPVKCWRVLSGQTNQNFTFPAPIYLNTGISISVGTTGCFTKTASVHAFISADVK